MDAGGPVGHHELTVAVLLLLHKHRHHVSNAELGVVTELGSTDDPLGLVADVHHHFLLADAHNRAIDHLGFTNEVEAAFIEVLQLGPLFGVHLILLGILVVPVELVAGNIQLAHHPRLSGLFFLCGSLLSSRPLLGGSFFSNRGLLSGSLLSGGFLSGRGLLGGSFLSNRSLLSRGFLSGRGLLGGSFLSSRGLLSRGFLSRGFYFFSGLGRGCLLGLLRLVRSGIIGCICLILRLVVFFGHHDSKGLLYPSEAPFNRSGWNKGQMALAPKGPQK